MYFDLRAMHCPSWYVNFLLQANKTNPSYKLLGTYIMQSYPGNHLKQEFCPHNFCRSFRNYNFASWKKMATQSKIKNLKKFRPSLQLFFLDAAWDPRWLRLIYRIETDATKHLTGEKWPLERPEYVRTRMRPLLKKIPCVLLSCIILWLLKTIVFKC